MVVLPEATIFRRFSALSTYKLLYLQAELRNFEADRRKYEEEDHESQHPVRTAD